MPEKTAVIYCRVSTARQADEQLPIASQRQRCEEKARQLEAEILRVFCDEGISGQHDGRPAFQSAVLYCEANAPTYFIAWNTSRFARNRLDAQLYKRRLHRAGTELVYAGMEIDRTTDGGWLTEGILELFDEFTAKQIAADTLRSMLKTAQAGHWCGGRAPFGFRIVPDLAEPKRKRLESIPEEVSTVRRIFEMRAAGFGARSIALTLNGEGILNRRYRWNVSNVLALLRNPAMIGQLAFGRVMRVDGQRQLMPKANWIVVDSHAPIIARPLWETVQRMIDRDALICTPTDAYVTGGSPHSTFAFTGLLRCGRCGASLQIEHAKGRSHRYSYYCCRTAQRQGACVRRRIPARAFDDWLMEGICADVFTPDALRGIAHDVRQLAGKWHDEQQERGLALDAQIKAIARRNAKLYEVLEEFGRDTPNLGDLTSRLRENHAQLRLLQGEQVKLAAELPPRVEIDDSDLERLAGLFVEIVKSAYNPAKARAFFAGFIKEITVQDAHVHIDYDPSRLIQRSVHGGGNWRPEPAVLGTTILHRALPAQWAGRAR